MATSQNGWRALQSGDRLLHTWIIPTKGGNVRLTMRNGSAGFLLAIVVHFIANRVERVVGPVLDDWGVAYRLVRGSATDLSNHASGTAVDVNATRHPLGKTGTWHYRIRFGARRRWAGVVVNAFLKRPVFGGAIRWGRNYHGRRDEMHFEINAPMPAVEAAARRWMSKPRGRAILEANPSQRAVILS